jgi:hypothetical protein
MWAACVVAAIALSGVAFMLGFLVALLREGAPSVWYWVVPVRGEIERATRTGKERNLGFPSSIYVDESSHSTESDHDDYYLELENENSAQEYASGLIALDVDSVNGGLGWRPIRPIPSRGHSAFHQHRL